MNDIDQTFEFPWANEEVRALALGISRDELAFATWLRYVEQIPDTEIADTLHDRAMAAAHTLAQGTIFLPVLRLALLRVDWVQLAEWIHVERSRRDFWGNQK